MTKHGDCNLFTAIRGGDIHATTRLRHRGVERRNELDERALR